MKYIFVIFTGILLCSCSNAPVLRTISSTVETDRKMVNGKSFGRTLSLTAAVPFTDVGNVWRYEHKPGYATALGVTKGNSYLSRTEVSAKKYLPKDLNDLKIALQELQLAASARVTARFNQLLEQGHQLTLLEAQQETSQDSGSSSTSSNNNTNTTPTTTSGLIPNPGPPIQIEPDERSETPQGFLDLLPPKRASSSVLYQPRTFAVATETSDQASPLSQAEAKYHAAYIKVAQLLQKPGIVVMRWEAQGYSRAQGGVAGFATLGGARGKTFGGLIVAAGLRQSVLHVGPDIHELANWIPRKEINEMKVMTHALQTKHAIWVKEATLESVFGGKIKLSRQDAQFAQALKAAEIEMAMVNASISNLSSLGYFSEPKRCTEPVNWSEQDQIDRLNEDGWLTIFTVDTSVKNLRSIAGKRRSEPLSSPSDHDFCRGSNHRPHLRK